MIHVNFSNKEKTKIVSYFSCAQDADAYPNQGTVEASDPLWITFYESIGEWNREGLPAPVYSK